VVGHREPLVQRVILRQGLRAAGRVAVHRDRALGWLGQAHDEGQEGRLARAVRADEGRDRALGQV